MSGEDELYRTICMALLAALPRGSKFVLLFTPPEGPLGENDHITISNLATYGELCALIEDARESLMTKGPTQ